MLSAQIELPQLIPASPEASNFLKFQEAPVSLYSGKQVVNIPVYQIDVDGVSIPIQLNYNSGGIRVGEIASSVGLGWELPVGGQITRVIKGKYDEKSYLSTTKTAKRFIDLHLDKTYEQMLQEQEIVDYFIAMQYGPLDIEPDEFHYNFANVSGKFVFNQVRTTKEPYGEIVMLPETDVKITPIVESVIIGWEIQDTNGNTYIFGPESWANRFTDSGGEFLTATQSVSTGMDVNTSMGVFTSWNIKKIITSNNHVIEFEYVTDDFYNASFNGETKMLSPDSYQNLHHKKSYNSSYGKKSRLVKISTEKEHVYFDYGQRDDLSSGFKLEKIEVKGLNGNLVNKVVLNYSYFMSDDSNKNNFMYSNSFPISQITDLELQKRLKLLGVDFYGNNLNNQEKQTYTLEYNEEYQFPNRYSYAQDSWGFYNGKITNSSFLPKVLYGVNQSFYNGSDRSVQPNYAKTGLLTKITYPSGGYTKFEYESNKLLVPYSELVGLEPLFGINPTSMITSVKNEINYMDRRRYNSQTQLYEYTFVNNFEILSEIKNNGLVNYQTYSSITGYPNSPVYNVIFQILKKEGFNYQVVYSDDLIGNGSFNLVPGEYQVKLFIEASYYDDINDSARVVLNWENNVADIQTIEIGGLRIKEIINYTSDSSIPKSKKVYEYPLQFTTGFMQIPNFLEEVSVFTEPNSCNGMDGIKILSHSIYPLLNSQGGLGYKEVREKVLNPVTNDVLYENVYNYTLNTSYSERRKYNNFLPMIYEWGSGNLKRANYGNKEEIFYSYSPLLNPNQTNYPEKKAYGVTVGQYPKSEDLIKSKLFACTSNLILPMYTYTNGFNMVDAKVIRRYENGTEVKIIENYDYDSNILKPTQIETVYDNLDSTEEKLWYSGTNQNFIELQGTVKNNLESKNIKRLIKSVKEKDGNILLSQVYKMKDWGSNKILPEYIQLSKGNKALKNRIQWLSYDIKGNPTQVKKTDGPTITYLWGYNYTQPIAKIENATYAQVMGALGRVSTDDLGYLQSYSESQLRTEFHKLRNGLSNAMVTTFLYMPLVGVKEITDPKGYKMTYEYDDFNRLKSVKDAEGKLLEDYSYKYKN